MYKGICKKESIHLQFLKKVISDIHCIKLHFDAGMDKIGLFGTLHSFFLTKILFFIKTGVMVILMVNIIV